MFRAATKAFSIHAHDPLPSELLLDLIRAVGEEGLNELMEPIQLIAGSILPLNDEDHEFEKLRIRFARDHFGTYLQGDPDKEGKTWKRYQELREKRAHQSGPLLRNATTHALRQLGAVDRPDHLMTWALGDDPIPSLHLSTAIDILAKRPDAVRYRELFVTTGQRVTNYNDFWAIRRAIVRLTPDQPDKRKQALNSLVRQRLSSGDGFMNDVFLTALAHDLTGLRDQLQAMATASPTEGDGDCAESAGGGFQSPEGIRYHVAREVLAIWSEPDAATRARMWCAFVLNHHWHFDAERHPTQTGALLKQRASQAIRQLAPTQRKEAIDAMLLLADADRISKATMQWLKEADHVDNPQP